MSANASRSAPPTSRQSSIQVDLRLRRRRRRFRSNACSRSSASLARVRRPRGIDRLRAEGTIAGDFLEGLSRESFRIAHDISSYSFPAMAKAAAPRLRPGAALLTLTYLGSLRSMPSYQHDGSGQGLARSQRCANLAVSMASAAVRVKRDLRRPIKTLAAAGIKGFGKMLEASSHSPLGHVSITTSGKCGRVPALRSRGGHHLRDHLSRTVASVRLPLGRHRRRHMTAGLLGDDRRNERGFAWQEPTTPLGDIAIPCRPPDHAPSPCHPRLPESRCRGRRMVPIGIANPITGDQIR